MESFVKGSLLLGVGVSVGYVVGRSYSVETHTAKEVTKKIKRASEIPPPQAEIPNKPVNIPPSRDICIQHDRLRPFIEEILSKAGFSDVEKSLMSNHLVEANLKGHDSHGVQMVPAYIEAVKTGRLKPRFPTSIELQCNGQFISVNGKDGDTHGAGHVLCHKATVALINAAKQHGIAVMALKSAFHVGRVGTFAEMATREGLVSFFHTNVVDHEPIVAPYGGIKARCGTNPYTCGIPFSEQIGGIVLDFATSTMANGKLQNLLSKAERVPDGVVINKNGEPSNDPSETFKLDHTERGCILPFGLHKGASLMLVNELLAGAVTGANATLAPKNVRKAAGKDTGAVNSVLAIAFDPKRFANGESACMEEEISAMSSYFKSSPPMDPNSPVLLPGEKENLTQKERLNTGITIPENTWKRILTSAREVGVSPSFVPSF
eukprot:m.123881 g.123881  ORF g.123881 m.123881 type:complete len:434 (+) comp29020_c0_seq1:265-1566(+)